MSNSRAGGALRLAGGTTANGVSKDVANSGVSLNLGLEGVLTLLPLVYVLQFFFPPLIFILHFWSSAVYLYMEITAIIYAVCLLNLVLCKGNNPKYE